MIETSKLKEIMPGVYEKEGFTLFAHQYLRRGLSKLWRLYGNIPPTLWKELITHYYRDNKLIGEYFNGRDEQEIEKATTVINDEIDPVKKCVPYSLNEGDGLRFSIRYKQRETSASEYDILVRTNQVLIKSGSWSNIFMR